MLVAEMCAGWKKTDLVGLVYWLTVLVAMSCVVWE